MEKDYAIVKHEYNLHKAYSEKENNRLNSIINKKNLFFSKITLMLNENNEKINIMEKE